MGQLEAFGINEMYLAGLMIGLISNYIAEEHESDTFESFKPYFYSAALSRKQQKLSSTNLLISEPDEGGQFLLNSLYNLETGSQINMTKILGDYPLFQRPITLPKKIDEYDTDLKNELL